MKTRILALLAATSLSLAGCTVNGGATLTPLISEEDGSAVFAVSANVQDLGETVDIRSTGNYRNSEGVSFAFRARSSQIIPAAMRQPLAQIAPSFHDATCGFFAGTFTNARGFAGGVKTGVVFGGVASGSDILSGDPATIVELIALPDGGGDPYVYVGKVNKGNLRMPSQQTCFEP